MKMMRSNAAPADGLAERKAAERKMRKAIAADMASVLTRKDGSKVRWKASKTDLMEALHWTYMNDAVTDADGSPCRFSALVERACRDFGMTVPRNPRRTVTRACCRMGVRNATLCRRCSVIAQTCGTEHPLLHFVTFCR